MKKLLLFCLITYSWSSFLNGNEWQLWIDSGIKGNPLPFIETFFEQEFRITNNMKNLTYVELDPTILFEYYRKQWVGFQAREIFALNTTTQEWDAEAQPSLFWRNSFNIGLFDYYSRLELYYRLPKDVTPFAAIRFRPGLNLFKLNKFTVYFDNEFFYNNYNFQHFDKNRLRFGVSGNLIGPLQWGVYYMHEGVKATAQSNWTNTQVIGITLNARI